jgi:hypothetical protein
MGDYPLLEDRNRKTQGIKKENNERESNNGGMDRPLINSGYI